MLATYSFGNFLLKTLIYGSLILPITPQVWAAPETSRTSQICRTESADVSLDGPVPTVTGTEILTISNIVVETVTPTITQMTPVPMVMIPRPRLSIITVSQATRTMTELTTTTATLPATVAVATSTEYVGDHKWLMHRVMTVTETIPTQAGFIRPTVDPIGVFKRQMITGPQRSNAIVLEDVDTPLDESVARETNRILHKRGVPSRVVCTHLITVIDQSTRTITGISTVTVTLPSPAQTMFAGMIRSTIVPDDAPPDALVTITSTITEEVLTTAFVTERAEVRVPIVTTISETVYEACGEANMLSGIRDEVIAKVTDGPALSAVELFDEAQTPYDCCVACNLHPNCGGTSFRPNSNATVPHGKCRALLTSPGDCKPENIVGYFDRGMRPKNYYPLEKYPLGLAIAIPWDAPIDTIHIASGNCGHLEQGET